MMIRIEIAGKQHPSLNKWTRWHWGKKSKIKKEWEEEIMWKCKKYGDLNYTDATIEVNYYFPDRRVRDFDNYVPKFILDGLVKANIIEDDNDNNIFLNWKLLYDKENPRTVITIKEDNNDNS